MVKLKTVIVLKSREEAETALGEIAKKQVKLDAMEAHINKMITDIKAKHATEIIALQNDIRDRELALEDWSERNYEAFGKSKTLEMLHGSLIYRTGTPKVKTIRGYTFDRVIETALSKGFGKYVLVKNTFSKEAILADYSAKQVSDDVLKSIGIEIDQEESFRVEPKLEEISASN